MSSPTLLTKVHARLTLLCLSVAAVAYQTLPAVNVLKGKVSNTVAQAQATPSWDDDSVFDKEKEKDRFRQYDDACDHVKAFYREQHGTRHLSHSPLETFSHLTGCIAFGTG